MNDVTELIDSLSKTPKVFENLLNSIPNERLKEKRVHNKWTIHEHVCHLAQAEQMLFERFNDLKQKDTPQFSAYLPGQTVGTNKLIQLDLSKQVENFKATRKRTIQLIRSFSKDMWMKKADHDEYYECDAYILLRHVLMHDFFHMYRIEELWLTKENYLNK